MPVATDSQMQRFSDDRVRTFAEKARDLYLLAQAHRAAIDDVYARATANPGTRWHDNRADGPPHLLQSGYDGSTPASPDDMLNFNTFCANLITFFDGSTQWQVLIDACVRAPGL